jgi:1-pyrroline-5-carboxylate dehydrogenase
MLNQEVEIPLLIGGREIRTGDLGDCRCSHDHALSRYHKARAEEVDLAGVHFTCS